eukprot:Skav215542  [mRNA]  locus=scaffold4176:54960:56247:- [translate_table: standard]
MLLSRISVSSILGLLSLCTLVQGLLWAVGGALVLRIPRLVQAPLGVAQVRCYPSSGGEDKGERRSAMVEEVRKELLRKGGTSGDWAAAVTSGLATSDLVWVSGDASGPEAAEFARRTSVTTHGEPPKEGR